MTNNQLALDFAREVMGWEQYDPHQWNESTIRIEMGVIPGGISEHFHYNDSGKVLAVVQRWCDEHKSWLAMEYYQHGDWRIEIQLFNRDKITYCGRDLSTALMTACLEAERKRIGAKGGE